jgi:hypothetical protein
VKIAIIAGLSLFLSLPAAAQEADADGDGLSDFQESHKYFTDPARADSDNDGRLDGDWDERREFTYTVRTVLQVLPPCNTAAINDDYQDARVLDAAEGCVEIEVVHYPFNTCVEALSADPDWRAHAVAMREYVDPGVTTNWDEKMRDDLLAALREDGIDVLRLNDREAVERVSAWLCRHADVEDSFTVFGVEFPDGRPAIAPGVRKNAEAELRRRGRTLQEQWDRELFGEGMFRTATRGTCTSSATYIATGLRAVGIPTRIIICTPAIDASDEREVRMLRRLTNHRVRSMLERSAASLGDSWASHTFNEVFVGGRWRRLNYDRLGQNILDEQFFGLMTHVHTYNDLSEAGLTSWGLRDASNDRADLYGGSNPYSCISISDRFGPHCTMENPSEREPPEAVPAGYTELTVSRILWYAEAERRGIAKMRLDDPDAAGHIVIHVEEGRSGEDISQYQSFYSNVGKDFVLRAGGHDDIPLRAVRGYWTDIDRDIKDFYLRIEPADFGLMVGGVSYELSAIDDGGPCRWIVRPGLTLVRGDPVADDRGTTTPAPENVAFRTITEARWAESADSPDWVRQLSPGGGGGMIVAHVQEWDAEGFEGLRRFTQEADHVFHLVAAGRPEVLAQCAAGGVANGDGSVREVVMHVSPGDFANVARGVEYALRARNEKAGHEWRVGHGVSVVLR